MPSMVDHPLSPNIWRLLDLSLASVTENLALEEALARSAANPGFVPTLRLWIDPPAVVVGRFQNVESEVDVELCKKEHVKIARRFTGGGAVFHDEGNLNMTLVMRRPEGLRLTEFLEKNSSVIMNLMGGMGLKGTFVPPNSIHVGNRKIAGAAAALGRDFALWHASILVSTDLARLSRILSPSTKSAAGRFTHSRWQPVTTLTTAVGKPITVEVVKGRLIVTTANSFVRN